MDLSLGDSPETDVQLLVPAILEGAEEESLALEVLAGAFHQAQAKCSEEGIVAVFVPYGEDKLAIVETGPEKAKIIAVR